MGGVSVFHSISIQFNSFSYIGWIDIDGVSTNEDTPLRGGHFDRDHVDFSIGYCIVFLVQVSLRSSRSHAMGSFKEVLDRFENRADLHARFLNTLSLLEYIGARKIVKSQIDRSIT